MRSAAPIGLTFPRQLTSLQKMVALRLFYIPLLMVVVGLSPVFCPCSKHILAVVPSTACSMAHQTTSAHSAAQSLVQTACCVPSDAMCCQHVLRGVVREQTRVASLRPTKFAAFIRLKPTPQSVGDPSLTNSNPLRGQKASRDVTSLLRQHCALII